MSSVSIVISAKNEALNLPSLTDEIATVCEPIVDYEIVIVDDGSDDQTLQVVEELIAKNVRIRVISHNKCLGKSAGVHTGVEEAKFDIICTLDGDGQNPPFELPKFITALMEDQTGKLGLVAGTRVNRQDTLSKRLASKFANAIRASLLKDGTPDTGCGFKAFRRADYLALPYFDNMHRYLPALFRRDGWEIQLVDVVDRPRQAGQSNYSNWQRGLAGIVDLFGVYWLIKRRKGMNLKLEHTAR